jgi:hypothetical protein
LTALSAPPVKLTSATHDWTPVPPQSISVCEHPPPLHSRGAVQSAFEVQLVRQPELLHTNRPQLVVVAVPHAPVPLQVFAGVKLLAAHTAPVQTVPAAYLRQAPAPSHVPSLPQLLAIWSVHWFSGSWPAGTTLHVPRLPIWLHAWQVPLQAVAQHTPCAQTFEAQSVSAAHVAPFENLPHLPAPHGLGLTQSVADVHDVLHVIASQLYGVHDDCVPG